MSATTRKAAVAFVVGLLMAVALSIGGMTQPSKINGFLDVAGHWDPSLILFMGGAIPIVLLANAIARRRAAPVLGGTFAPAASPHIDLRLVGGAALFGVGWGLSSFCPGPALVSIGALAVDGDLVRNATFFVPAMVAGMVLYRALAHRARDVDETGAAPSVAASECA